MIAFFSFLGKPVACHALTFTEMFGFDHRRSQGVKGAMPPNL